MPVLTQISEQTVQVNDLYLGAYLLSKGAELTELRFDLTSRASLVFSGQDITHHRKAYSSGDVCICIPELKSNYNYLRDTIYRYQNEYNHPKGKTYAHHRRENPVR